MNLTDEQEEKLGNQLALGLRLMKDKKHPSMWCTAWGVKTGKGLWRLFQGIYDDAQIYDFSMLGVEKD